MEFSFMEEVCKTSRKPFQSGKRVEMVEKYTYMELLNGKKVRGVYLTNCISPVEDRILTNIPDIVSLMKERDQNAINI